MLFLALAAFFFEGTEGRGVFPVGGIQILNFGSLCSCLVHGHAPSPVPVAVLVCSDLLGCIVLFPEIAAHLNLLGLSLWRALQLRCLGLWCL